MRRVVRWRAVVAVAVVAVLASGCVKHPVKTVVLGPIVTDRLALLSGSGSHVVLARTSAAPSHVPWVRFDRATGESDDLPAHHTALAISGDGQRIVLRANSGGARSLWVDGEIVELPHQSTVFDDELRYGVFAGADGLAWRWDVLAGTTEPLEEEGDRPPDLPFTEPIGISEDGTVVAYWMHQQWPRVARTVDLDTGVVTDVPVPNHEGPDGGTTAVLSSSGSGLVIHHLDLAVVYGPAVNAQWVEVWDTATGELRWRRDLPGHEFARPHDVYVGDAAYLGIDGVSVWLFSTRWDRCPWAPPVGPVVMCIVESHVTVYERDGVPHTWDTQGRDVRSASLQHDGWMFADDHGTDVRVYDRVTRDVAVLAGPVAHPQISDSSRLIATAGAPNPLNEPSGWVEFTPEDGE